MGRSRTAVCHLTSVHGPFDHRIFEKECVALTAAGFDVSLIAVHQRDESVRGIRILALPTPANRLQRMTVTRRALLARACALNASLYHFHDPELLPVGLALAARGHRVIYDVHEDVPRDLRERHYMPWGISHAVGAAVGVLEQYTAKRIHAIVTATPHIGERFRPFAQHVEVVRNYPALHEFGEPLDAAGSAREGAIAYAGSIDPSRGILPLIDALSIVNEKHRVRLLLAGRYFPSTFRDELSARHGWQYVDEHGQLSREALRQLLQRASVGVVLGEPNPNMFHGISNKLFEYMASGLPVVASDFPEWRAVIESSHCGMTISSLDPETIADAIGRMLASPERAAEMGRRGRAAVEQTYNWNTQADTLVQLYDRVLSTSS